MSAPNPHPSVRGRCPACGNRSLFVGAGGWLTCSIDRCPNPTAIADILELVCLHHTVELRPSDFSIEHPMIEKLNGSLHACPLDRYLHGLSGPPRQLGRYHVLGDVTNPDLLQWVLTSDTSETEASAT